MQPLEQQRGTPRIGTQEQDRTVAVPVLEGEVLVLGLLVRPADLEHRRPTGSGAHRDDQRRVPVGRVPVDVQRPLLEQVGDVDREPHYFFGLSPAGPEVESAAMKASWGTSTRPTIFIRFLPSFCFSSSLRLRVMSPP